jgi:hypothetical protein
VTFLQPRVTRHSEGPERIRGCRRAAGGHQRGRAGGLTHSRRQSRLYVSDANTEVIRRYNLLHKGGGQGGADIARPAEFLVDRSGVVRWVNFTEDIRVRAKADEMLAASKAITQ